MVLDCYIESCLVLDVRKFRKIPALFKTTQQLFKYKNPKYLENERWGYSNHGIPPYLYSYEISGKKLFISRGGLDKLVKHLKKFKIKLNLIDRTCVSESIDFEQSNTILRPDQEKWATEFTKHSIGCGMAYTSFGKCHQKGTKIIMFNGLLKSVEDIRVGDKVMGVDSTPRLVKDTCIGYGEMYRVSPLRGKPFVVNKDHILSLKVTNNSRNSKNFIGGDIKNIPVSEYLNLSKAKKHILKLWRTNVDFTEKKLPFDPYFIGLWFGDGSKREVKIYNNDDPEIVNFLEEFAVSIGYDLKVNRSGSCPEFCLNTYIKGTNKLRQYLRNKCVKNDIKQIPRRYILNDRNNRLMFLAGLLDADGHLVKTDNKTFEIAIKQKVLCRQVAFLSRSLGLSTRFFKKESQYRKNGKLIKTGFHYRMFISGDTYLIPTKIKRKRASDHKTRTNPLVSGFKIEPIGKDNFYGFTLNRDKLYLLEDFTVNHNTVVMAEIIKYLKQRTTILVHTTFLQKQWIKELTNPKLFNLDHKRIGGVGGVFSTKKEFYEAMPKDVPYKKRILGDINVCLYHSVCKPDHLAFFEADTGCLIFDEGQKTPIEGVQRAANKFRARFRYSCSANFKRKDGKHFLTFDTFGPIRVKVDETASSSKILSSINIIPTPYDDDSFETYTQMISNMSLDKKRNIFICKRVLHHVKQGKLCVIFVERKVQAAILFRMLSNFRVDMLLGPINKKSIEEDDTLNDKVKSVLFNYDHVTAYDRIITLANKKKLDIIIGTQKIEVGLSIRPLDYGLVTTPAGNNIERFNQIKGRFERTYSEEQEDYFGCMKPTPLLEVLCDYKLKKSREAADTIREVYKDQVTTKRKVIKRRRKQ